MQTPHIGQAVLSIPRPLKRILALLADAALCVLAVWVAYGLRLDDWGGLTGTKWIPVLVSLAFAIPLFVVTGFYRAIFRYAGWAALMTVAKVMLSYGVLYSVVFTFIRVDGVPRTIGLLQPLLLLILVGGMRVGVRYWLGGLYRQHFNGKPSPRVLVYGAGSAGRQLVAAMLNSREMLPVGFVDEDPTLQGNTINGLLVTSPGMLEASVKKWRVTDVLLAIPSAQRERRNEILSQLRSLPVHVRTLPSVMDLASGRVQLSDLRELDIEDLLGRSSVAPDSLLLSQGISGHVVLVTGAGGSIGSELSRQILAVAPKVLLLVEISEFALYAIHQELDLVLQASGLQQTQLVPLLASVRDEARIEEIIQTWKPSAIYHAAAYKHVPLVEQNPAEGIRNNVFGTLTVARVAAKYGVSRFVLISTDKAVRPTNIMGASKRLAELILQALAQKTVDKTGTNFSMVRFGNVLGSSGSVVPKFRQQIKDGGPITLTHLDITRYFMTIPEAAQLVVQAGAMAQGGEVFVLDMGQPVRILDLAQRMIALSGLRVRDAANPEGDIEIVITGLRPGEKLYEELLIGENPEPTLHPRIMKAHEDCMTWETLERELCQLETALQSNDVPLIRTLLSALVVGYQPSSDIVDWVYLEGETVAKA